MKKFFVAAAILSLAGTAFAGTVAIPFFLDDGATTYGGFFIPTSGVASFIGLLNTTGSTLTLTATYSDFLGNAAGGGTYDLAGGASVAFRPSVNDPAVENTAFPDSSAIGGALIVTHGGGQYDVIGRLITNSGAGQSAYTAITAP